VGGDDVVGAEGAVEDNLAGALVVEDVVVEDLEDKSVAVGVSVEGVGDGVAESGEVEDNVEVVVATFVAEREKYEGVCSVDGQA
jgi:hypothetical protein